MSESFTHWSVIVATLPLPWNVMWTKQTVIACLTCWSNGLMGGPWPMNAAIYSRPSAVSLNVWLRETAVNIHVQFISCSCSSVLFSQHFQSMYAWSNWITWDIGLFRLGGSVRHVYKLNNLSNLWISAYWRRKRFQTIQFDLVNWHNQEKKY